MADRVYDCVVLGAGPGGVYAALGAAGAGLATVLVERDELGGVCLNRGCVPSKTLLRGSRDSYPALLDHRDRVVADLRRGLAQRLSAAGVELVRGEGRVAGPGRVAVDGGKPLILQGRFVVLAAGSAADEPAFPGADFPGAGLPGVETVEQLMVSRDSLPESLLILGGGCAGVETAFAFSRLGSRVAIVEARGGLLPGWAEVLSRQAGRILRSRGVQVVTGERVESLIRRPDDRLEAVLQTGKQPPGGDLSPADKVVFALGRRPRGEDLFAPGVTPESLGIELAGGCLWVDENLETGCPGIFALGDLISGPPLESRASAEGRRLAEFLGWRGGGGSGRVPPGGERVYPLTVFTDPEILSVGMEPEEAERRGTAVIKGRAPAAGHSLARIREVEGVLVQLLFFPGEEGLDRAGALAGAQVAAPGASEMAGYLAAAVEKGFTAREIRDCPAPHPSWSELLSAAAEQALRAGRRIRLAAEPDEQG